jgi:alpha-glucosidase
VGSMTNWTPRMIEVPLNFLGAGAYTADIYEDSVDADVNPKHVHMRQETVHKGQTLTLKLASGGGCAIRFVAAGKR